jgi:uncharacterized Zn finger protein (UPF0148 family)
MAIARATCTCATCGETFEKRAEKRNRREADSWEQWAVENYDECPKCYGASLRQADVERGLVLSVRLYPFGKEMRVQLTFVGDTYPHKDNIKRIGRYHFEYVEPANIKEILSMSSAQRCWTKIVSLDDMDAEIEKAKGIGATIDDDITPHQLQEAILINKEMKKLEEEREAEEAKAKETAEQAKPEIIRNKFWNGKVYGKAGKYRVYLDNKETYITDAQADELKTWANK